MSPRGQAPDEPPADGPTGDPPTPGDHDAATAETFAEAVAVERVGDGTFRSPLHPAYHLWGGTFVHGGYAMAVASRAMAEAAGRPDAVTLTAHFVEQVDLAPVEVATELVRVGRRHATVAATLRQGERTCLRLLGTFGDVAAASGPSRHGPAPEAPPWDECIGTGFPEAFRRHVDGRLDPATAGFLRGEPTGSTSVRGRLRFHADEVLDAPALAFLADVMVSPAIEAGDAPLSWIPTVELTVHVHDPTWRGEVLVRIWVDHLSDGYATEDVEVWAGDGSRLLATGRQLALVRG